MNPWLILVIFFMLVLFPHVAHGAATLKQYYAHAAVEDDHGVIAPWYLGQNGQLDFRVRTSAETLKRYPWVDTDKAVMAAPHFVYTSMWQIDGDGNISAPPIENWMCGDLGQRTVSLINGMADYYRYSGDPAAIAFIVMQADYILDYALTPAEHAWPRFPISVPTKGKPYGQCDPAGFIQLDLSADIGNAVLRAYQITGDTRYFDAAKKWGDVLAAHCDRAPGKAPWPRYANPEQVQWSNQLTGSITIILRFLDQLIRLGYAGTDNAIVSARDAGRAYMENTLLPRWAEADTWGRYYWDWECPVLSLVNDWASEYMMDNRGTFPHWRNDCRNILSLIINRTGVDPASAGETYSGAWAMPESPSCCGTSLSYGQQLTGAGLAQYAALTGDPWAREMARRMALLGSYDIIENGAVIDGITGTPIVAGTWLNIIHPLAMRNVLQTMYWLPDIFGPNRENHIMRSSAEVVSVVYEKGRIAYKTFDAPAETITVLRLAFAPVKVMAAAKELSKRDSLDEKGYTVSMLSNGDCILSVRHDGLTGVVIEGDDPQSVAEDNALVWAGAWMTVNEEAAARGNFHVSDVAGASMACSITGNQVRVTGSVSPQGGLADVFIDGVKQPAGIDCWNPGVRHRQILFSKSGLANAAHELKIVVRGEKNLRAQGKKVFIGTVQLSVAAGDAGFGLGGGPNETQRFVFGYTGREDIRDAAGKMWRPATEWILRLGQGKDSVGAAWWTTPAPGAIDGTDSPDVYRYGAHAPEFIVNATVAPGKYRAILKFAATRGIDTAKNRVSVFINGERVIDKLDVVAKAGAPNRALDLEFKDLSPRNGVIEFRFVGGDKEGGASADAFVQAIEVGPMP